MAARLFAHRPGLDGIRGYGMVVFMLWHVGALTVLPGLWVFMNVFFILSAFLVTRLLLAERRSFGDISVRDFYLRRVRRLGPALLVMLGAVTLDGLFFAPDEEKAFLKGDILATLTYVMNWRLVARDDQYFEAFNHPSITRHAWSLSVEEQFYLVVPWLVVAVLALGRTRLARTLPFVLLAGLSALWATRLDLVGLGGQSLAYYGTDIRVQALALGVAAGVWSGHRGSGGALLKPRDSRDPLDDGRPWIELVGWLGLAATIVAFATVEPLAPWMFSRGGMLLTSIAATAWVIGCAQRRATPLVRVFSLPPAVYTGKISYGLYLYHWPIFIWLSRYLTGVNVWVLAALTLALSYGAAALSYRFLERPIVKHGLGAFGRRRTGAAGFGGLAAVVVGALFVSGGTAQATAPMRDESVPQKVANIPQLVEGQPAFTTPKPPAKVALFGDSVPFHLASRFPSGNFPGLEVVNLGTPGCDIVDAPVQWTPTVALGADAACRENKAKYEEKVRTSGAKTFVIMPSLQLALRHQLDGRTVWLDDPAYVAAVRSKLSELTTKAEAAGARSVQITTVPCRRMSELNLPPQYRTELSRSPELVAEAEHPKRLNTLITTWAKEENVPVVDLASAVCGDGYQPTLHGKKVYEDGIHFSPEATPMIWGWLAPQVLSKAGGRP